MLKRHTQSDPCVVCGGYPEMQRGQGTRCVGFLSGDGWCHCTRVGEGTQAKFHEQSDSWSHRTTGRCPCGDQHAPATAADEERDRQWKEDNPGRGGNQKPQRQQARATPQTMSQNNKRPAAKPANVQQIGDTPRAKIVAEYEYRTVRGELLYVVCRTEPKSFRQKRPDGKGGWLWFLKAKEGYPEQPTTLYRLPQLVPALAAGDPVFIVEGEKDVEALDAAGWTATCNSGGAGKWRDDLSACFEKFCDRNTIKIIQDRDDPDHKGVSGQEHARRIYDSLEAVLPEGCNLSIVEARAGKDASDHFAAGFLVSQFDQVWPIPDDMLETHPGRFKQVMLRRALERPDTVLNMVEDDPEARAAENRQPIFRTGAINSKIYPNWRGAVAIAGAPSAGKSFLAISTAIDAALAGWDVFYLSSEMSQDIIRDRAARSVASANLGEYDWTNVQKREECVMRARTVQLPSTWNHLDVGIGVTIEMIVEMLCDHVNDRPTLVVFDSLSSFVDSMEDQQGDAFGMGHLKNVTRWVTGTRKLTHGHLAYLLLSELNKEGRAKGRSLDHRCDTAISMTTDPDHDHIKLINVTKNWWGQTGSAGSFVLHHELGRLVRTMDD